MAFSRCMLKLRWQVGDLCMCIVVMGVQKFTLKNLQTYLIGLWAWQNEIFTLYDTVCSNYNVFSVCIF